MKDAKAPDAWLPVLMEVELDASLMQSLTQLILVRLHVTACDSVSDMTDVPSALTCP